MIKQLPVSVNAALELTESQGEEIAAQAETNATAATTAENAADTGTGDCGMQRLRFGAAETAARERVDAATADADATV